MSEILAPAGGPEALRAALMCGADAVYIGGKDFSARQNAANFSDDEIFEAAKLCHLYGAKLYIAVNTMLFDSQLEPFLNTVRGYAQLGADALIVQDIGAARLIHELIPDMPLHASTQMTIHTAEGALFAKEMGFSRIVAARELSEQAISEICSAGIEVEAFVHGALCMSVSGQCYMSAVIGSRSANRGLCAQACRLPFSAGENSADSALSLKDMCHIGYLQRLSELGVFSFKTEGRMKRPEYVAAAVTACRAALNGEQPDIDTLRAVFSRSGFTDGYITGKRTAMFGTREKDDVISAKDVLPQLRELYRHTRKCTALNFSVRLKKDSPLGLEAWDNDGNRITLEGDIPQTAINKPTDGQMLSKQLSKLGDTVYKFGTLNADIDDGLMLPVSSLNELRRRACEKMNEARIKANTPVYTVGEMPQLNFPKLMNIKKKDIRIRLNGLSQLSERICNLSDEIILPMHCLRNENKIVISGKDKLIIEPPRIITDEKETVSELKTLYDMGFTRLMCNNAAYLKIGKDIGFELHGDCFLNVGNSASIQTLAEYGVKDITASFELKLSQLSHLADFLPYGIIAYGRLPLMLTRNCPVRNGSGLCRNSGNCSLTDRTGRHFPVVCDAKKDYTEILNSDRLFLADRLDELNGVSFLTLLFYDESASEAERITELYRHGGTMPKPYTRGLYYRGII